MYIYVQRVQNSGEWRERLTARQQLGRHRRCTAVSFHFPRTEGGSLQRLAPLQLQEDSGFILGCFSPGITLSVPPAAAAVARCRCAEREDAGLERVVSDATEEDAEVTLSSPVTCRRAAALGRGLMRRPRHTQRFCSGAANERFPTLRLGTKLPL